MIKCECGQKIKSIEKLSRIKFWSFFKNFIGNCPGCGTSIHFLFKGKKVERAPEMPVELMRKRLNEELKRCA